MIVAIDGPSAAGKGTLARRLAAALDFAYLDTGLLYRAVGARLLAEGRAPGDPLAAERAAAELEPADLERADLRSEAVAQAASEVAAEAEVRARLLAFQRRFAASPPDGKAGAVLDGRDIATVVCPEAEVKVFLTASLEARAARRLKELQERGENAIYPRVLQEMRDRDARDSGRAAAPLRPAEEAIVLDTTEMDSDAVFDAVWAIVQSRLAEP
ncbi:MAG: (d)CMP kinase [Kiloniellales bacterium]|nr:(d)CMP kinase [Kiloniellales bacterium]